MAVECGTESLNSLSALAAWLPRTRQPGFLFRRIPMFRWDIFSQYFFSSFFLQAAWVTLWISVVAQASGVNIGLFLALMRMSRFPFLSWPARAYVWLFRGSPLLVQVLILWDGLPKLVPTLLLSAEACVL